MNSVVLLTAMVMGQCPPVYYEPPVCYSNAGVIHEKVYFSEGVRERFIVEAVWVPTGRKFTVPIVNGYAPSIRVVNLPDGSSLRELDYNDRDVYEGGIVKYGQQQTTTPTPTPKKTQKKPVPLREEQDDSEPVPQPKQAPRVSDEEFAVMKGDIRDLKDAVNSIREDGAKAFQQQSEQTKMLQDALRTLQDERKRLETRYEERLPERSPERQPMTLQATPEKTDTRMKKPSEFGKE